MRRAGWIAAAIVGWSVCGTTRVLAQAPPPEGWVVLSIDEYQALRDRSRAVGPPAPSLPVDGTLSRVEYDLHIDGDMITGRGLLTVDVLRDGWARIPIPAGLIVSDARVDGTPAALVEGAPPYVLISRTGRTVVSLDLVVPIAAAAGTESISLPASPASVTKTTLLLPRSNVDLSLTGGLITDHIESTNESRWTVYGHPNEPLKLSWKHRVDDRRDPRALSVTVIRYTPQAVLVANVLEARYRVLAADERVLVEARYAIRNNQRSFLKVTLPADSTVWSAVVDGQPIRPGMSDDNSILLPIGKGRTTEEAPTSDVTLVYLRRTTTAARRDRERLVVDLPAVDLPVSRTAVRLYFQPRFQVTYEPGSFRVEGDTGPIADALQTTVVRSAPKPVADPQSAGPAAGLQGLVDRFRTQGGERRITGALPVVVDFPEFGPSTFLVSELMAEGQAPSLAFQLKRARK